MEKLLLTPEEAAEVLGIGRSKLYQLLADGTLDSVKLGGLRRVSVDALREFVSELRRHALTPRSGAMQSEVAR